MSKRTLIIVSVILAAMLLLSGCSVIARANEQLPTPAATIVSEPSVQISEKPVPEPTVEPTEKPAVTPATEPTAEPVPEATPQAEKTFADLAPTINMSFEELVGNDGDYEDPAGWPAAGTYRLIVDIYHQVVMAYEKDEDGEYTVPVRYMVCSTGRSGHSSPTGTFKTGEHHVRFGKFVNDGVYGQYWSQIVNRIYFHSLLYTRRDASTYTTSSYKKLGSRASHGCIRLLVPDARWIYYHLAPGTEVEIRSGSKSDAETAAIKEQLVRAKLPSTRPTIKKGDIPMTDNWTKGDIAAEVPFTDGQKKTAAATPAPTAVPTAEPEEQE